VVTACQMPSETRCLLLRRNSVFKNLLRGIVLPGSCHGSGCQVPAPHCRGLGASLDQSICDLWWAKCPEAGLSQSTPVLLSVLSPLLHTNHYLNPAVLRRTRCEAWESSYKPVLFWWRWRISTVTSLSTLLLSVSTITTTTSKLFPHFLCSVISWCSRHSILVYQ